MKEMRGGIKENGREEFNIVRTEDKRDRESCSQGDRNGLLMQGGNSIKKGFDFVLFYKD